MPAAIRAEPVVQLLRMRTGLRWSGIGLLLLLAGCGDKPTTDPSSSLAPPQLQTLVVSAGSPVDARGWDGVVEAVRQATVSAQTSGRVTSVDVDVNDRVTESAVLLSLTSVEQQAGVNTARAQLRSAEAVAAEAEQNYKRYAALAPKQHVSEAQVDQARAAHDTAVAMVALARAQLAQAEQQTDYTIVRAPFAGIISRRDVEPGETVSPGQQLMTLYAPEALRIQVQLPQSVAAGVSADKRASVELADGRSVDAAEVIVYPASDPATHSVTVRIALPDIEPAPAPGTTAHIVFPLSGSASGQPIVHIPTSALVQRGEVNGVYVLAANTLQLRQLRLGRTTGEEIEVLAGLKPDEIIAADPVAATQALVAQREMERQRD